MKYKIDIYETDELNEYRFALGSLTERTLFCFGINPSTADDKEPDRTIKRVMGFAERNGYTSFMMFNVYPQRETKPENLPREANQEMVQKNIEIISRIISQQQTRDILLAWGNAIYLREYLIDCLKQIHENLKPYSVSCFRIGESLKSGQPRHPLFANYDSKFQKVDLSKLIDKI